MTDVAELRARLEELNQGPPDAPERLDAMAELAWQDRFGDWREAARLGEEAHELATASGQVALRAKAARALIMYRRWRHDLAGALDVGLQARDDFRELGDRANYAAVLDGLSTIVESLGDYSAALEYGREAYEVAVELEDPSRQGWALSSLGGIYTASGDFAEAIRILEKARAVFSAVSDNVGILRIDYRMGKALLESGDIDGARDCYQALVEHCERHFSHSQVGYGGLGDVARAKGDLAEAKRLYEQAELHLTGSGVRYMQIDIQLSLVRLHLDEDDLDEAHRRLTKMLAENEESGAKPLLAQMHELLAETCERRGDAARALHHHKRFSQLRQEILGDETRATMLLERNRRELESARKDAEIHRLRFVELANMQTKLVESEKLAALGQLAAGIAHELNTPLGVLRSNLDLLRSSLDRLDRALGDDVDPQVRKSLRAATSVGNTNELAVERLARFVRSVTSFSGVDQATSTHTDLRRCVETVLDVVTPNLHAGVRLVTDLEDVPSVWAHPARINQALMAVIMNAAESSSDGGELTVKLHSVGDEVVVEVRDTGPGMDSDELANLFEVAFESSGERVQLALGLPAVAATMHAFGGRAEAASEPGRGTTITLRFPVSETTNATD